MTGLSVDALAVDIGRTAILRDVSVHVEEGQFCVIVGPSGCGKSTLLRAVAGLRHPTAGRITVGESILSDAESDTPRFVPAERRRVGWVPQEASLFPHLTVAQNVAFGRGARRDRQRARDDAVPRELLRLTGLADFADRYPDQLSGGQRQRVALARALAAEPRLLLLDEPFAALDPQLRAGLREEVRTMLDTLGITGVLVTHDQAEALQIADTVVVMRDGRVEQQGSPADVYRSPANAWAAAFLGDAVFLDAVAQGDRAATALGGIPIAMNGHDDRVTVMLRPEQLTLGGDGAPGVVTRVRYGGHDALIDVRLDTGLELLVRVQAADIPRVDDRVAVTVRGAGVAYPESVQT